MTYLISKIQSTITFLLIASIGYTYGNWECSPDSQECEDSCCQPDCCGKGFISAELLYWRAFENGLDRCIPVETSDIITLDGRLTSRLIGRSHDPNFKWNPGFRLGIGYEFACSNWDVEASWSYFHTHSNNSFDDDIDVQWNLDFDVLDIVAGYKTDLSHCFALRPFAGIRSARINQKFQINEFSLEDDDSDSDFEKNREEFLGIGPLIGLEADWDIGCGFSLYASASISLLYGHFDLKFIELNETLNTVDYCKLKKDLDASLDVVDISFGVQWRKCYCDRWLFLQLGLEHHRYFDYNRLCDGDLSLDGVNLSGGIEF